MSKRNSHCQALEAGRLPAVGRSSRSPRSDDQGSVPYPDLVNLQEQLRLETNIAELQLKKELAVYSAERQRQELEATLAQQKLHAELAARQSQICRLTAQTDLINRQSANIEAMRKLRLDAELADQREALERIKIANELAAAGLATRNAELLLREKELTTQQAEFNIKIAELKFKLELQEQRDQLRNRVNRDIAYTKTPFRNGVLVISDRRIALNGPIVMETAQRIQKRIDYYNNQSAEYPIFIVIDSSPGGSVMSGYKILKAMAGSPAPVYVVVKSFAASMAAGITTLARKSFAYPNAIILHHQILRCSFGNLTQHKEGVKELEEFWNRLASPVAAKMGVSLDAFIKQMYEKNSNGDWMEFGDSACKLKWVDKIVQTVREESLLKNPDTDSKPVKPASMEYLLPSTGTEGNRHAILPRLEPVDCYYLYNPDGYYRIS